MKALHQITNAVYVNCRSKQGIHPVPTVHRLSAEAVDANKHHV